MGAIGRGQSTRNEIRNRSTCVKKGPSQAAAVIPSGLVGSYQMMFSSGFLVGISVYYYVSRPRIWHTTVFRHNFPGFACSGDLILSDFQNQFCACSAQPRKNANQYFCLIQYA